MSNRLAAAPSFIDPDVLAGEIQAALAALADVETRFALDQERLDRWTGPAALKERLLEDLRRRRQVERDLLVERLAELQADLRRVLSPGEPLLQLQ
jgi:hypothetical protein